jgi:hypothetical protein
MVTVKMTSTVYYGPRGDKRRYGPGDAVLVPEGLAQALGLTPIPQEVKSPPSVRKAPVKRARAKKALK